MAAKGSHQITINRPIEQVFDFAATNWITNHPRWSPSVRELRQTSDGAMGVGTTAFIIRLVGGEEGDAELEVVEYEPPHAFAFKGTGDSRTMTRYLFEPAGDATQVTQSFEAEGGFPSFLTPVVSRGIKSLLEGDLGRLKELVETGAVSS